MPSVGHMGLRGWRQKWFTSTEKQYCASEFLLSSWKECFWVWGKADSKTNYGHFKLRSFHFPPVWKPQTFEHVSSLHPYNWYKIALIQNSKASLSLPNRRPQCFYWTLWHHLPFSTWGWVCDELSYRLQPGKVKRNKCSTKPDLLCWFSAPAGLKMLVQIHFWEHDPPVWLNAGFVSYPARTRGARHSVHSIPEVLLGANSFLKPRGQGYLTGQQMCWDFFGNKQNKKSHQHSPLTHIKNASKQPSLRYCSS